MPEKQSASEKLKRTAIKVGVITMIVSAIFGSVLLLLERSHSRGITIGMPGSIFIIMSPVIGVLGAIVGAVMATENVSYTIEDHQDDNEDAE